METYRFIAMFLPIEFAESVELWCGEASDSFPPFEVTAHIEIMVRR